ncbi:MAG TPA: SMP-30/gluconolactonase/LRE family protein [Cyclobacteriaceae bacterium]|nr:SMP-30/gluconolactonase/LRE family protein [Cyclobacteriaceae bacterium]
MQIETLFPSQCILAEGPLWHKERNSCFWVDIERGILYECNINSRAINTWSFDYRVTMVIQARNNNVILALDRSLARFDLENGTLDWLVDVEKNYPNHRCNDGACDSQGRIWVGTMALNIQEGAASLYCINTDHSVSRKVTDVTISNGLAWTADDRTFYYIDTPTKKVQAYHFNAEAGDIALDRTVIEIPDNMGSPDGMAIDEEGMLWIAHYGGFGVYRWNPHTGECLEKIEVPVPNVTSCAFVGPKLDQLLITTASENLSQEQLQQYPQSGDVFLAKVKVKGQPVYTYPF